MENNLGTGSQMSWENDICVGPCCLNFTADCEEHFIAFTASGQTVSAEEYLSLSLQPLYAERLSSAQTTCSKAGPNAFI